MKSQSAEKAALTENLIACAVLLLARYEDGWSEIESAIECALTATLEHDPQTPPRRGHLQLVSQENGHSD
jgi:hypothetical protein